MRRYIALGLAAFCWFLQPAYAENIGQKWSALEASINSNSIQAINEVIANTNNASIGLLNRKVNLMITPKQTDHWPTPDEVFQSKTGDCKSFAIVKYFALKQFGYEAKILVVWDKPLNQNHAVVAVKENDDWYILDNLTLAIIKMSDMKYIPLYQLDDTGVKTPS